MKKIILLSLVVILSMAPTVFAGRGATGSAFGSMTTARAIGRERAGYGLGIGLADATSFTGSFTYGLSEYTDGRIRLGLIDADYGDTEFVLGADLKWQFWTFGISTTYPFDFALGGHLEYADYGGASVLQLGSSLTASYPAKLKSGHTLTPYGRLGARLESWSQDVGPISMADDSGTDLELGLNLGVEWSATATVAMIAELQFDGNDGLFLGVVFGVI